MNSHHKHRNILALLALLATALVLHLRVLGLSFLSDDLTILYRIGVLDQVGTGSFFRPLPDWTHWLNYKLAGPRPWAFRLVNVLLLGFNGWLLARVMHRLSTHLTLASSAAWWAAVLFVAYPYHQEPQVWIVARGPAMATSAVLLAVHAALGMGALRGRVIGVALCTFIGTMCYEHALLIPGLLIVLWTMLPSRKDAHWWPMVASSSAIVVLNLALRAWTGGQVANAYGSGFFQRPWTNYIGSATKVIGRLFLPPRPDADVQAWCFLALGLVLVALLLVAWRRRGSAEWRAVLVLLALTAVSAAVAVVGGVSTRTSESDRFLYLPAAFLCAAVAVGLSTVGRFRLPALLGLVFLCMLAQWKGHSHWVTASSTLERIISATPTAEPGTRVFISGLPGDHRGAYILRHGYQEALLFAGRDTTGLMWVDSVWTDRAGERGIPSLRHGASHDTVFIEQGDRALDWNGSRFVELLPKVR